MKRSEAREEVFYLLFESEFQKDRSPEEIYALASDVRELPERTNQKQEEYIRRAYFGVCEKRDELDEMIGRHSNGWRPDRIAPVSRNLLRLCVYEMLFEEDVPTAVAINEAVELTKRYDEPETVKFVNGILGSFLREEVKA
jgi:N utilization substance protein B